MQSSPADTKDAGPSAEERAILAALRRVHLQLVACHRTSKNAVGEMTLRVVIGVNHKVEATAIESGSTVPEPLAQCIEARVRALSVETTPITISVPFRFRVSPYDGPTILYGNGPFDPGY